MALSATDLSHLTWSVCGPEPTPRQDWTVDQWALSASGPRSVTVGVHWQPSVASSRPGPLSEGPPRRRAAGGRGARGRGFQELAVATSVARARSAHAARARLRLSVGGQLASIWGILDLAPLAAHRPGPGGARFRPRLPAHSQPAPGPGQGPSRAEGPVAQVAIRGVWHKGQAGLSVARVNTGRRTLAGGPPGTRASPMPMMRWAIIMHPRHICIARSRHGGFFWHLPSSPPSSHIDIDLADMGSTTSEGSKSQAWPRTPTFSHRPSA